MLRITTTIALTLSLFQTSFAGNNALPEVIFNAQPGISKVDLVWISNSNEEISSYTIERSKDGELWAEILTVESVGTCKTKENYLESDFHPLAGTSFYRLKKKLSSGYYAYSNIVTVKNNVTFLADGTSMNPPVELNDNDFSGYSNDEVLITLKDIKGNEFFSRAYVLENGTETIIVDVDSRLAAGKYVITSSSLERIVSLSVTVK